MTYSIYLRKINNLLDLVKGSYIVAHHDLLFLRATEYIENTTITERIWSSGTWLWHSNFTKHDVCEQNSLLDLVKEG